MGVSTTMGQKIRKVLEDRNMTQTELARRCGFSNRTISRHININKPVYTYDILKRMCEELDVSADWLLGLDERRVNNGKRSR